MILPFSEARNGGVFHVPMSASVIRLNLITKAE